MTSKRVLTLVLVGLLATCAVAASVAVAAGIGGQATQNKRAHRVVAHATAAQGLAALAPVVASLGAPRTAQDDVPSKLIDSPLLSDGIAAPSLSHRVGFSRPTWFVPGSDGKAICVLTTASLNCPPISDVLENGLAVSAAWTAGGPVRVLGIAADGVTTAEVTSTDGRSSTVGITNNLLDFSTTAVPREVDWSMEGVAHQFVFPRVAVR
jgi:hypothetical protein